MVEENTIVATYIQTEIGSIPEDWKVVTLPEVGESLAGLTYSPNNVKTFGTLVLRSSNIQNGRLSFQDNVFVEMELPERVIVKQNDILICVRNGSKRLIGKCALIDQKTSGSAFGAFMSVFRSNSPHYVFFLFQSNIIQRQINESLGATINQITNKDLARFQIPLPPTTREQTAIATALSDVDTLIESLEKLLIKKQNIKIGAMQELLKPKLNWTETTLLELADNKKELFDDGDWIEAEHITDDGIRIVQTGNVGVGKFIEKDQKKYINENSFKILKCKTLEIGDLLICRLAEPAGRACILPNIGEEKIVTSVDVTIFRPTEEKANRIFLKHLFSTAEWFKNISEKVGGTTHKRISRGALGKIKIFIPHLDEQNRIASFLFALESENSKIETLIIKYKNLKTGMMQDLLTGKKRLI